MAINKKLITFDKKLTFLGANGINNLSSPVNGYYNLIPTWSMVFIKDTGEIWHDGVYFGKPIKDQISPIMQGTTKGLVFTPNGTDYYYKTFNLWGNTFDGDTININGDLVVQGVTYKWTYGDASIKKGNTNLIAFSNNANNYDVFIPNGNLNVTGGDIDINNNKIKLSSTGSIKGTYILNTNSYFNADNTLGKTWNSIKLFNTSGATISLDTTRPAIINILEHAHASSTLWVPWIAGGDITAQSSWGIGLGGDAFYIGRIAKAHTENSLSQYWKFDSEDGITISGTTKYIKVANLSGASEKVFLADGTVKALSELNNAIVREATTTNYGGFKLTQAKASSQQSLVASTTGNGRYAVKMNADGTLYVEFSQANTWKAANSSQEGYVPKSTANKILRSDANGALYWGNDSNTWKEVTTSLEGYVPKIVTTGSLASTDSPFILVFKNVSGSTKTAWVPLPANAFKNDNTWTPWAGATASANGTAGYMPAPTSALRGQFLRGDGTWVSLNNYSLPTASSSTLGGVKTGAAITDTTGYTAVAIKDGIIYYKDTNTTYSFSNLLFLLTSGTNLMTYNSQAARTVLAGSNITFTHSNNVLTIAAKDTTYSAATSSALGLVKIGDTLTDTTGYTKVAIKDGIIYYKDTNTTYSTVSKTAAGLCPALPNETTTTKYLRLDGTWVTPPNDNTWRGIYVGGTSKIGTGTNTLPINFVAGSNVSITYEAAGTGSGKSGNAGYFNVKIAATDTTYSDFVKSGSTAAHGLVPKPPTTAGTTKYLREDGTWQTPPNDNTWKAANASQEGYVPKSTANKILRANGDGVLYWGDDANTTYTFYNLLFQNSGGTTVDTYKPTTSPTKTLKAGSNVTISAASNVITIASTNTWNAMTGATASANGTVGYVNATPPKDGYNTKFLRADGTWSVPAYPTKASWNYDDRYVSSLTTSGNSLRWVKNGSNNDITIPYATSAGYLTDFTRVSRVSKNSDNTEIESVSGWQTAGFILIQKFCPPTMYRTTGDAPAPYGIGFGNGSESGGIMPIGLGDKLEEIRFYGANSGPTIFTFGRQLWEDTSYDTRKSNKYITYLSINSTNGNLTTSGTVTAPTFVGNLTGSASTLGTYAESAFLRYRASTNVNGEATLWSQLGLKQYSGALPDSLSGVYNWGQVVSFATQDARFEIYASHQSSNPSNATNGLYYRTGWGNDKRQWTRFLDSNNSSVTKSGETLTVKINGTSLSLTNTWRGIQDNLTSSSSTTESLSAKQGYLLANGSARDNTKLPLSGGTMVGTISAANDAYGGGGFNNGYANIILRGNTTTGTSGIVFSSSKGDTSINRPSDCAFIQFLPYGVSAATAVGTNPTINTSGESGRFVIGIHNDSGDLLWLQTSAVNDLKHVVGANVYTIYDSGNLPAYPTKASWNYDDVYVKSVSISGNNLRINKNGTNTDLTIPYATNSHTVDGYHASSFVIDAGGVFGSSKKIYEIGCKSVFSGSNMADAPTTGWVSGIVLGSNWNNEHYQHYLVESINGHWYTTREYENGSMKNWKQFAYITDNVASATKLETARTLWGQSFNGTANVSGNMTGVGTISASGDINTTSRFVSGLSTGTHIQGLDGSRVPFNSTAPAGYNMVLRVLGTGGAYNVGAYLNSFDLIYGTQALIDAGTNSYTHAITLMNLNGLTMLKNLVVNGRNNLNTNTSASYRLYVDGTSYMSNGLTLEGGLTHNGTTGNFTWGNITIYGGGSNGGTNSILIGDDVTIGDCNVSGSFGMKSTGANAGFRFFNSSRTSIGGLQSTAGTLQWLDSAGTAYNVIHSGNINSQLPQRLLDHTSQYNVGSPDNFMQSGFAYGSGGTNAPYSDYNLIGIFHTASGWGHQLAFKFNGSGTTGSGYDGKDLCTRLYNAGTGTWTPWYDIITSGNIGSQSVSYATSAGNAITANSPYGFSFSNRASNDWSGVTGTFITDWAHSSGADIMFKNNGGALHVITDGYFYLGIDYRGATYRVLDEYDISHTKWGDADTVDGYHAIDMSKAWYTLCYSTYGGSNNNITWFKLSSIVTTAGDQLENDWMIEIYSYGDQNYVSHRHGYLRCNSYGGSSTSIVLSTGPGIQGNGFSNLYATIDSSRNIWLGVQAWFTCKTCFRIIQEGTVNTIVKTGWTSTKTAPNSTYITNNGALKNYDGTVNYLYLDNVSADLLDGTHKADLLTAASLGASGNSTTLSVTVGGTTKTGSVTVPYATNSDTLDGVHNGRVTASKWWTTSHIDDWYERSDWDGSYFWLTAMNGSGSSLPSAVAYATSAGSATDSTKLPLAGGTMTGNIIMSNNSWVQGWIFTGETGGSTQQYKRAHGIEIGHPGKDTLDFFEYSGIFSFYQTSGVFSVEGSTSKGNLVAQINTNGVTSAGFIKSGSTSAYVLTGDGGHAAISGLSVNYANNAGNAGNADTVDGYHEGSFFRYRGNIDVNYVDLTTYTANAANYQNPSNGVWNVSRQGYSAGLITFTGYGSASGLDIYFHYSKGADFKFRRRIDSNRLSGDWETFITSENIGSQSVNYANSAGSVAWGNVTEKPLSGYSGNNGPVWGNYVPVKSDGVMEIGKYLDFHNSSNDGVDYAVRLMCQGNNQVIINLPTSAGTLALTSLIPSKSSWNYDDRYVRAYGTDNNNIDADWGQSFKTFDPIPSGTSPELNPNISLLSIGDNFARRKELAFTWNNDNIYYRRHVDSSFSSWVKLIHSGNYTDYTVTKTGSGASGTWGINVTGSAGSVAWANVTGKPDTFTPSTHNHNGSYSYAHQTTFAFNEKHDSNYVTFDLNNPAGAPDSAWYNGFVTTHNGYLSSYIINGHRSANWYVGYSENSTAPTWYKLIHSGNIGSLTVQEAKRPHSHGTVYNVNTVTDGIIYNYSSEPSWLNAPSGMSYGSVLTINSSYWSGLNYLGLQLAWDVNHGSSTNPGKLWFRTSNEGAPAANNYWVSGWSQVITSAGGLTINGSLTASSFYTTSDIRTKKDISNISEHVRKFKFKKDNSLHYGFIALELEVEHPELVDNLGEYKTVDYNSTLSLLLAKAENKIKELENRIKVLEDGKNS